MKPTFRFYPLAAGLLALLLLATACRQDATPTPVSTIQGMVPIPKKKASPSS
jgi:hypothetical protein